MSLLAASLLAASALGAAALPLAWGSPRTARYPDLAVVSVARRPSATWGGSAERRAPATTMMFTDGTGGSFAAPLWWAGSLRAVTPVRFSGGALPPTAILGTAR